MWSRALGLIPSSTSIPVSTSRFFLRSSSSTPLSLFPLSISKHCLNLASCRGSRFHRPSSWSSLRTDRSNSGKSILPSLFVSILRKASSSSFSESLMFRLDSAFFTSSLSRYWSSSVFAETNSCFASSLLVVPFFSSFLLIAPPPPHTPLTAAAFWSFSHSAVASSTDSTFVLLPFTTRLTLFDVSIFPLEEGAEHPSAAAVELSILDPQLS
mmetsp:Transcript_21657/g.50227  ORF Transcript_21657/g.50227 Transcript_21657/m.50227 type:complete len:212 (-) Transcript_21657:42-677(-)